MNVTLLEDAYIQRINTIMQPIEVNLKVVDALRFVMQNVLCNIANNFYITISTSGGPSQIWLYDIIGKLFVTYSFMVVQLIVLDDNSKRTNITGRRYCNMIMINSFENLIKTHIEDYNRNSDGLEYYFIFLHIDTDDNLVHIEMEKIFKYCFDNFWLHCNVMIQNRKSEILVYTYFPFKDNQCFQPQLEIINKFNGQRFVNEVMFPDKLKNLHRCPLKLTTWIIPPFVINKTNNFISNQQISGFEVFIITEISRAMNFTLDIDVISFHAHNKSLLPGTIPMKRLENFETNITLGYFRRTAQRDKIATATYVTYYLSLVAVSLRRQNKYKSLSIFTFPFDTITWSLILLLYGIIIALSNLHVKNRKENNLLIFQILFGMSVKNVPKDSSKRAHFITVLLSSFFLRSIYQSLLFYLFHTHLYKTSPTTIDGLVAEHYKVVCTEMSTLYIGKVPQFHNNKLPLIVLHTASEMEPLHYLSLNHDSNYAAISIYDFAFYYGIELFPGCGAFQVLPISVNDQQISFYLAKHSYLHDRFNSYILWFQQAGLQHKWKEWTYFDYQISKRNNTSLCNDDLMMVNLNDLAGFFIIITLLFFISFVIFLVELLWFKI